MAKIVPQITRTLDNGYVQVEIAQPNKRVKFYKMPQENAEHFCDNYGKNSKKMRTLSDLLTFCCAAGGFALVHKFNKSLGSKMRAFTDIGGAIITAGLGSFIGAKICMNDYKNFMQEHKAEEFIYENKLSEII
ncbi:MAG: hypothetical protein MJ231_00145 [bacterium]|nr:hypothetical protein [bacterium]